MKRILSHPLVRVICLYLVLNLVMPMSLPSATWASFIRLDYSMGNSPVEENSVRLQIELENAYIAECLRRQGLSLTEIDHRVIQLSAEERQVLISGLQNVQVGGSSDDEASGGMGLRIIGFTIGYIIGYTLVSSSK